MKTCYLLSLLLLFAGHLAAQTIPMDTSFVSVASTNATEQYLQAIKGQSQLFNGADYFQYQPIDEEHPYLDSYDWILGSVFYDGNYYKRVYLQYDISTDQIVTEHYYTSNVMQLIKSKVDYFTLRDRKFIRLDSTNISKGFYEVLYDGTTRVLARHTKALQETYVSLEIHREFNEKTRYYIYKNGNYFQIKSKSAMLKVLGDKRRELNQFAGKNKIKFKKNKQQAIVKLAEFYDHS